MVPFSKQQIGLAVAIGATLVLSIAGSVTTFFHTRNIDRKIADYEKARTEILEKAVKKEMGTSALIAQNVINATAQKIEAEGLKLLADTSKNLDRAAKKVEMDSDKAQTALAISLKKVEDNEAKTLTKLQNLESEVIGIRDERKNKSEAYLMAARESKDDDVKNTLYLNAIELSNDKAELLKEYAAWQRAHIEKALAANSIADAGESLGKTIAVFDAAMGNGSVKDMASVPALKKELSAIEGLVAKKKENVIAQQLMELQKLTEDIIQVKTVQECDELQKQVESMPVDSALEEEKEKVAIRIAAKRTCLTPFFEPVAIPVVNEDTPWTDWLKHFHARLSSSNIPIAKRMEDLGTATEFLAEAKGQTGADIQTEVAAVEKTVQNLYRLYWNERAKNLLSDKDAGTKLQGAAELLGEANGFDTDGEKSCRENIIALNQYMIDKTLSTMADNHKNLQTMSGDELAMMASSMQAQYLQVLLQIKSIAAKYKSEAFSSQEVVAKQNADALGKLVAARNDDKTKEALQKADAQQRKFVNWAKIQLAKSQSYYDKGEQIAGQWTKTANSPAAIEQYLQAWDSLTDIYLNDLQVSAPVLHDNYLKLKDKIENRLGPDKVPTKKVDHKRINDF